MKPNKAGTVVVTVGLVTALALSGCTSKKTETKPSPSITTSTLQPKPLPPDAEFVGEPVGAAADVAISNCPTEEGKQVAKGTVKNSAKEKRDYAIMVIWLKRDNGTPMGSGLTLVRGLEPGANAEWTVNADVIAKSDTCTKNVKAGRLKS